MILLFIIAFVKPICLPYEDDADDKYYINDDGQRLETWVAGWGATNSVGKWSRLLFSFFVLDPRTDYIIAQSQKHWQLYISL